ncbi:MAG: YceI family protein [Bacteroidetes bacterium]|nr:YceI family protein [Bacteroidota bacterium]
MKSVFLILIAAWSWTIAFAQYKPVDQGSAIQFTVQNFGFDVTGTFKGINGTIYFDQQKPADAQFNVDIDAGTVNTDNSLRDDHLRGESYFDVKNHPRIKLESLKIQAGDKTGTYLFLGKLTIKNTTKNIFFPFTATAVADGYQFNGTFRIKRKDFGVGGTSTISDELQVSLNVIAKKS